MTNLLEIESLRTFFPTKEGIVRAVDGVSLKIRPGEVLGLVGESGSGKSITALSILRLISPPGRIVSGSVCFRGEDISAASERRLRQIRGNDIAMIFQDPMTSLNPVFTIGEQIAEVLRLHKKMSRRQALEAAVDAMREVAIPSPEIRVKDYPHQLSGGMRQRVMIAMALACEPELLIADEPTTALDVTIQAQILELLAELRRKRNLAILLITHDLGVVAETADRVAVMYTGRLVEEADTESLFADPKHPYTRGLLESVPKISNEAQRRSRLKTIEGVVPRPTDLPSGCHFAPRCAFRRADCNKPDLPLLPLPGGRSVRCVLYENETVKAG
ncbi:MAG: ABC transporter ATP-binding protein [Blastocatellia bacterium]